MRIHANTLRDLIIEAMKNAYGVLGLNPGASDEEIKKAWRALAIANHPDRGGDHGKMVDINAAKDRLMDKDKLFRYGPTFKGYEDPSAKPAAEPPRAAEPSSTNGSSQRPEVKGCSYCGRTVAVKDGKYVNHYTYDPVPGAPQPNPKCPNSNVAYRPDDWNPGAGSASSARSSGPSPGSAGGTSNRRYFTFTSGNSRKFWEVETVGYTTLRFRWGRIGSAGNEKTKKFNTGYAAAQTRRRMIDSKLSKGYVESTPPAPGASPPGHQPGPSRPKSPPSGKPTQSAYKVYPWRGGRRVVRVGGKLYGTEPGGRLRDGGNTRFNANDRASVSPDGPRMKVTNPSTNHSQTWEPVDEVRQVIDELIMEMIVRIAEQPA